MFRVNNRSPCTQGSAPIELLAKNTGSGLKSLFLSKHKGINDNTLVVLAGALPPARSRHPFRLCGAEQRRHSCRE